MSMPTAKQLDDWTARLNRLISEIGEAYGGRLPSKLQNRQEARAERENLDQLATFEGRP